MQRPFPGGTHDERTDGESDDHCGGHLLAGRDRWSRPPRRVRIHGRSARDRPPARQPRRALLVPEGRVGRVDGGGPDRAAPRLPLFAGAGRPPHHRRRRRARCDRADAAQLRPRRRPAWRAGHRMSALAIIPHLVVRDAAAAAEWYTAALGAEERGRLAVPGGKLMQLELRFGSSTVMLADEFPDMGVLSPLSIGGTATVLHLSTDDVDAVWQRAIDGGAAVRQPLAEVFWGERYGQITDPFGHRWGLAQHLRDVPREQLERAVAELFAG